MKESKYGALKKWLSLLHNFFNKAYRFCAGSNASRRVSRGLSRWEPPFLTPFFLSSHCTKKWSFLLRISSVNVTISAVFCRFDHIYYENPSWKSPSLCSVPKKQFIINSSLGRLSWKTVAKDIFRAHWNIFDG